MYFIMRNSRSLKDCKEAFDFTRYSINSLNRISLSSSKERLEALGRLFLQNLPTMKFTVFTVLASHIKKTCLRMQKEGAQKVREQM